MIVMFCRWARTLLNWSVCRKRRRRLSSSMVFTSKYARAKTILAGGIGRGRGARGRRDGGCDVCSLVSTTRKNGFILFCMFNPQLLLSSSTPLASIGLSCFDLSPRRRYTAVVALVSYLPAACCMCVCMCVCVRCPSSIPSFLIKCLFLTSVLPLPPSQTTPRL